MRRRPPVRLDQSILRRRLEAVGAAQGNCPRPAEVEEVGAAVLQTNGPMADAGKV